MGADLTAQQELFLLAQFGEPGAMEANNVIAKILKAKTDGGYIGGRLVQNWSGWIHSNCVTARQWTDIDHIVESIVDKSNVEGSRSKVKVRILTPKSHVRRTHLEDPIATSGPKETWRQQLSSLFGTLCHTLGF